MLNLQSISFQFSSRTLQVVARIRLESEYFHAEVPTKINVSPTGDANVGISTGDDDEQGPTFSRGCGYRQIGVLFL